MNLQRPIEDVREAARRFLHLDDENVIDVAMAVYVANKFDADPLWMFFVSPPSTAKTEILMSFDGHPGAKILSTLTPRSLISGKTALDAKDCSLLPQLSGKVLMLKDFTSVLALRREDRNEIFSQLREIYDGRYVKAFGNEGQFREWSGKIGLMAGVTPAIDKHMIVNQMLGERMLYYRIVTRSYEEIAREAIRHTTKSNPKRKAFQQVVQAFLSQFDGGVPALVNEKGEFEERLKNLALVCSHARSAVLRHREDQSLEAMPEPEGPARLAKQLNLFAMALAVVRGQTRIDNAIYNVIKRTALDGLPHWRKKTLEALWLMYVGNSSKWFSTRDIAERVGSGVSPPTVKRKLEDLCLLNLVVKDRENGGAEVWFPSITMYKWTCGSGLFA
jgi:hypothetical protein